MTPSIVEFSTKAGELAPAPRGSWVNYVSGVVAQYLKDYPCVFADGAGCLAVIVLRFQVHACVLLHWRWRRDAAIGFDIAITTNVPLGSGLSSSAALEVWLLLSVPLISRHSADYRVLQVAVATFIEAAYAGTGAQGSVKKALRCQSAEHEFVGMKCTQ